MLKINWIFESGFLGGPSELSQKADQQNAADLKSNNILNKL